MIQDSKNKMTQEELRKKDIVSLKDLLQADIPPTEWIVPHLIPKRGITLLVGSQEKFKSFLGMHIAYYIATGNNLLGMETRKSKVLYVDEENGENELQRRFSKIHANSGLDFEEIKDIGLMIYQGLKVDNPNWNNKIKEIIKQHKPEVIIIDSLIRVFDGDENSSRDMKKLFETLRQHNVCWIVLHHIRKNNGQWITVEDIRGSSELAACAASILALNSKKDVHILSHGKSRCSPKPHADIQFVVMDKEVYGKEAIELKLLEENKRIAPAPILNASGVAKEDLLKWLKTLDSLPFKSKEVYSYFKGIHNKNALLNALKKLSEEGVLKAIRNGWWKKV